MQKDNSIKTSGTIFDIQRYSIHDGSGIRTIVFFKGCPLRCRWCSNPESQAQDRELMFSKSKCIQCGTCINLCHAKAIRLNEIATSIDDITRCDLCGECIEHCPTRSIKFVGKRLSVSDVMAEAIKDEIFYFASGGGVTFGGGEPFYQVEFLRSLLKACQARGINTAIETCGVVDNATFTDVIETVDHVLMDLKHTDEKKHMEWVGGSCETVKKNWETLAKLKKNVTCRIPVIPGFNDTVYEIEQIAKFVGSIGITEINLLAYHNFGEGKYDGLNRVYQMGKALKIPDEKIKEFQKAAEKFVSNVQIGG